MPKTKAERRAVRASAPVTFYISGFGPGNKPSPSSFLGPFRATARRPRVPERRGWHQMKALDEADVADLVSSLYLARVSPESVRYGEFWGRKGHTMEIKALWLVLRPGNGLGRSVDVALALALLFPAWWLPLVLEWWRERDLTHTQVT